MQTIFRGRHFITLQDYTDEAENRLQTAKSVMNLLIGGK